MSFEMDLGLADVGTRCEDANLLPNPGTTGDSRGPDFARIQQVIDPLNLDLGFESLSLTNKTRNTTGTDR